ncbi:PREDICTED: probable serine/threonine-protein kinase clkA [Vollenhovia emeryi]|uniref:probable serine/threonine-protein kinase clkA n=1 Tax=Vollenhovia emeryi TaxID=411798 RepID=UPI0005F464EA|nr:PREDICTED: probable serine/threonine-protein kinase clkA [Vollenhovia emeryi]
MHYASHMLLYYIALWCAINDGKAARSSVNPDILANFAKNVASVLSPVILGEVQSRYNRSSFQSTEPANLNSDDLNASILDNMVDKTLNAAAYYEPRSYPYGGLLVATNANSPEGLKGSEANERLDGSLRDDPYLRQEQPNFHKSYAFPANNDNFDATSKSSDNIDSSIGNIQESSTNIFSSYHGAGFPKAAFPHGPFLDKPYGGFHGFGPYGHHHHPYGGGSSEEASSEDNARVDYNRTNYGGYGSPYFGYPHPYSPFPYGGYGNRDSYGPYQGNGNNSSGNGRNGYYGHGPYYDGPDFYGPPGYGYGYNGNNNRNNNGNNNGNANGNANGNTNSRQTEEPAGNGDQNNSTKNGYSPPYGPPWVKPLLGTFHLHGLPSPFNLLPYDHFHGVFKGGPVVGVGPVGYPIYADPYLAGFPFHHPYGPFFHGKKYLPPKGKPADSGESGETTEAPAGLTENENPERITALNEEVVAPAPSSNRYRTSGGKELKRINLVNFESRRV